MGGCDFKTYMESSSGARDAFNKAVERAMWEHGHGGYTGTIAEKHGYVMLTVPKGESVEDFIDRKIEENDKWGPAFCIELKECLNPEGKVGKRAFVFFGIASS